MIITFMNDIVLQKVDHHPYLGLKLSSNLSWANHITQTVNKANSILGLLKRNLWNCSPHTKEIAYKTLVRPRLEYCSAILDPNQKVYQENLEKVQRRAAARFVTSDYKRTSNINDLSKKYSSSIGILNKVTNFLPESALLSLYNTLILSHINYGITAQSSAGVSAKNRLHILQKRALRAVSHSEFRSHSNPLFI